MKFNSEIIVRVFEKSIKDWHLDIFSNPFSENSLEFLCFKKNQIDTFQWHEEDEIRRNDISTEAFVACKRKIDSLNQQRTDWVEELDDLIYNSYQNFARKNTAKMNSETPAWLIDRMSILELKIYHMTEQTERQDADNEHIERCKVKLNVLLEQRKDMCSCLDELLTDIENGDRYFKVYKQMKMYNDKTLNPALYSNQSKA
ncbi:MAG: DUF4254 domain-containing protein [Cytophagales bacterium]|nr:MAG: DUF4254 domain-containing protein [Cytophagales bacterium]